MTDAYYDESTGIVDDYSPHQQLVLRWLSVSGSCASIVFGIAALYLYTNMRHKVFRHHLILLLLLCDFGKAVVLLWYPARVLLVPSAYDNINFCDVVGFFTTTFIEGADLAVLALAVHTALLVFKKYKGHEGGLYRFRNWVYFLTILIPLIMAALVFIDHGRRAYQPYVTWCYLPVRPVWYRLVLSWVPRYVIIVSIIAIYIAIYIYVKVQYRAVIKDFRQTRKYTRYQEAPTGSWINRMSGGFLSTCIWFVSFLPGLAFVGQSDAEDEQKFDTQTSAVAEVERARMREFEIRRATIERQIRSIFVYPIAYVFLWLAPFGLQCLQFRHDLHTSTVFWVNAIAAFMQPFNCVVDTIAFCIREKPWRDRKERVFRRGNSKKIVEGIKSGAPALRRPRTDDTEVSMSGALVSSEGKAGIQLSTIETNRGHSSSSRATHDTVFGDTHGPLPGNAVYFEDSGDDDSEDDIDIIEFLKKSAPQTGNQGSTSGW